MNVRSPVEGLGTHTAWKTACAGILIERIHWVGTLSAILLTGPVEGGCNYCRSIKSATRGDLDSVALRTKMVSP
jgi:hypothetical protein